TKLFSLHLTKPFRLKDEKQFIKYFFLAGVLLDIICQLLFYALLGFPLFMDSRLDATSGGGGIGLISRIIDVCRPISAFIMLTYLIDKQALGILRKISRYYAGYLCIALFLSGSKSSILLITSLLFSYLYIYRHVNAGLYQKFKKNEIKYAFLLLLFPIIVIMVQIGKSNFTSGIMQLVNRFVSSGDVYWMAYPGLAWENIDNSQPFQALFSGMLGSLRIVPWSQLPNPIGMDLIQMYYDTDSIGGPNARHNVFGLIYFGFTGSILFSFVIGALAGTIRKWFRRSSGKSILISALISMLYIAGCSIETDINMFLSQIATILLILPLLFGTAWGFYVIYALSQNYNHIARKTI
ncbi:hypothetical protein, partial [Alistipes indistinctus]|uniref:hypothetical protein n=1 Tax=Alistipes indistinctus TaxID=626932 RepID=UPI003F1029F1